MRIYGWLVPTVLVASLSLAACGSGSASSGGTTTPQQLSAAQANAQTAMKPAGFDAPANGPKSPGKGKHFLSLECAASAGGCARLAEADQAAGAVLGWTVDIVDGKGDAGVYNTAIRQAVAAKVDGIFLDAIPAKTIGDALAQAHAAGIPVVSQVGSNSVGTGPGDVTAEVNAPNVTDGNHSADWIINNSAGKAKVWMMHDLEFNGDGERYQGGRAGLQDGCSGCVILGDTSYQASTASTDLLAQTQAVLTAHPDIQYLWTDIDGFATLEAQAIRQTGRQDSIKLVGFDCNPANLQMIKQNDIEVACVGLGLEQAGWSGVDQIIRALSHLPPGPRPSVPTKLIDATNLPSSGTYEGDADFRTAYKQQWGVG